MRKLLPVLLGTVLLGGCAQLDNNLTNAYDLLTQTSIPPTALIVAANSFDAIEATATNYLVYCKTNTAFQACAKSNRQAVIKAVRAGRILRTQVESYISTGTNAPPALYQEALGIVTTLQGLIPPITGATK